MVSGGSEIRNSTLLIVEGNEEVRFFGALADKLVLQDVQIMPLGGKTQLRSRLKAVAATPGFSAVTSLGLVRDANGDPAAAFQSVRDALVAAKLPAPKRPIASAGRSPRVTVMILPGEGNPGMLEDLCLRAVKKEPAMLCIDQFFQCLQQQRLPLPRLLSKAKVHAYLSSKPETGKRLGEAAEAGYWPWEDRAFEQVKRFLKQLTS
jgi:hypothetical protein